MGIGVKICKSKKPLSSRERAFRQKSGYGDQLSSVMAGKSKQETSTISYKCVIAIRQVHATM